MTPAAIGGGSSAVASSSHAACARFRGTDPLITGMTRRRLATAVGFADIAGGIPSARWMRAMTFERLVRSAGFASRVATTTVGALSLDRPSEVFVANAHVSVDTTAQLLEAAHKRATTSGAATLIHGLAVPFTRFEDHRATDVKPDFAVVAPRPASGGAGSWLVVGDAKDYERLRSRIEDSRMLKGFLQVAVGAESCATWSRLPLGMVVHTHGVLAVPRNAFLQPEAVVENLHDYREEVRLRIAERVSEAEQSTFGESTPLNDHVAHLTAAFDPSRCATCTLFGYCRDELRRSSDPADLLIELGVSRDLRKQALKLLESTEPVDGIPASIAANITATLSGVAEQTGQLRVDQAGEPGTINVVIAKSDAAALGLHGIAIQRVTVDGRGEWQTEVFDDPQSPDTRRRVMRTLGKALIQAMRDQRRANPDQPDAIHIVVPDKVTADVLVSIADNLAGIELSRLRWQRDLDEGRPALTFDGEPATVPPAINEAERTAIAFLLEEDRARAYSLRSPIIDARAVLARHLVPGGPTTNTGRLDYLIGWAEAGRRGVIDHRAFADDIETGDHTPGARLTNRQSDAIHTALVGERGRTAEAGAADPETYQNLVTEELAYKHDVLGRALDIMESFPSSRLRPAYQKLEADAQVVWQRRLRLHASDLVRFGRTYRSWRNSQVREIESDGLCHTHLLALSNPQSANDLATSAGTREVAFAKVVSTAPLILEVSSRRIGAGCRIVLLSVNDHACVEQPTVALDVTPGSGFKIDGLSIGPLQSQGPLIAAPPNHLLWTPHTVWPLVAGDRLVVADFAWFSKLKGNRYLQVGKPAVDAKSAPRLTCDEHSYDTDPDEHQWCCRSHESREAEFSDLLAARRARGELNPQVWPPVRDADGFEVSPAGADVGNPFAGPAAAPPDELTIDDVD